MKEGEGITKAKWYHEFPGYELKGREFQAERVCLRHPTRVNTDTSDAQL